MTKTAMIRSAAGLVLFGLGLATGLMAQTGGDTPTRHEQKRTDLTGAPDMEVIASIVEVKPGETSGRHFHNGVETVYVLQGSTIQLPGKEPTVMAAGTVSQNLRGVLHGGYTVVGDVPLKLFTVHVVDKSKPLYEFTK